MLNVIAFILLAIISDIFDPNTAPECEEDLQ